MLKLKITKLILFSFLTLFGLPVPASATVYNVLDGMFTINDITMNIDSTGGTLNINEGDNAYQGFGEIFDPFMFSGSDVNVQTASSVGSILGGNAPSGNVVDGGTVDMSAFFVNWNGNDIYQGNSLANVTAISGGYRIAWEAEALDPKSVSTFWTIDIAEPSIVPVPATGLLMGSGLFAFAGFYRRRS